MARWLIIVGIALVVFGTLMHVAPWLFQWFGRLPGDIRIESERTKVFIPITSMVVISVILTVLLNLLKR